MKRNVCKGLNSLVIGCCTLYITFASSILGANDTSAEIAAGGLIPRQENRVAMKKERLFISQRKVKVEYEFVNESDQDVETEVAFPWPRYSYSFAERTFDTSMMKFSVQVEGKSTFFETQTLALDGKGRDITATLQRYHLNIPFFAYFDAETCTDPLLHGHRFELLDLAPEAQKELIRAGAFEGKDPYFPAWSVEITHHWKQRFPAHQMVHIAHEYIPVLGDGAAVFSPKDGYILAPTYVSDDDARAKKSWGCPDDSFWKAAFARLTERKLKGIDNYPDTLPGAWVRYILTTANTWKGPIEDFELIVEKEPGDLMTFCWDGPVEKIAPNRYRARMKRFRPSEELTIYFCPPVQ
jgi:hypothetical protein